MADLLVHLSTVYVPARLGIRDPAVRSLACLGVCLPDLLTRAALLVHSSGGTALHDVIHTPAVLALVAYGGALFFEASWRKRVFLSLFLGGLAHLVVDSAKRHLGAAGVLWGFPFSTRRFEWGLYLPENTVYLMAPALLAILLVKWWSSRRGSRLSQGNSARIDGASHSPLIREGP